MKKKALLFKKGPSKIGFSPEYDSNPDSHKDWSLNLLVVPDVNEADHHHFLFKEKEIQQIHAYLGELINHIGALKKKAKK